jgi:hypothetical protein
MNIPWRAALLALALLTSACGSDVDVSGAWTGTTTDNTGAVGRLTWNVTQTGDAFSGTIRIADTVNGTVSGTLSGKDIAYTMIASVPPCTLTAVGAGTASDTQIRGSYTATGQGCPTGAASSGQLVLDRP